MSRRLLLWVLVIGGTVTPLLSASDLCTLPERQKGCCHNLIHSSVRKCLGSNPFLSNNTVSTRDLCRKGYVLGCLQRDLPPCMYRIFGRNFINIDRVEHETSQYCNKMQAHEDYGSCFADIRFNLHAIKLRVDHTSLPDTTFNYSFENRLHHYCRRTQTLAEEGEKILHPLCGRKIAAFMSRYIEYGNRLAYCHHSNNTGLAGVLLGVIEQTETMSSCERQLVQGVDLCFQAAGIAKAYAQENGALIFAMGKKAIVGKICRNYQQLKTCVLRIPRCEEEDVLQNMTKVLNLVEKVCSTKLEEYSRLCKPCYGRYRTRHAVSLCEKTYNIGDGVVTICSQQKNLARCLDAALTQQCGDEAADFLRDIHRARVPSPCWCSETGAESRRNKRHYQLRDCDFQSGRSTSGSAGQASAISSSMLLLLMSVLLVGI